VTLNDASWVVVGQMVYVAGAGAAGGAGALQVTAVTGNQITLLNPTPAAAIPLADNTQAGLLKQLSGNTTDFVDGTNSCQNLVSAIQPTIWNMRLRSFNAIGNPNFEVLQRNIGNNIVSPASSIFIEDRWMKSGGGSYTVNAQSTGPTMLGLPSPSFGITTRQLGITLTGQETTMAAGDYLAIVQQVEAIRVRELFQDVSSISIFCYCNVALKFGISLRDAAAARSLTKLCSIPAATYTLVTLPNIPSFTSVSGGSFNYGQPGALGYYFTIGLASGSTYTSPANDVWQSGNYLAANGQDNFCAKPVNTVFYVLFVQHEPGSQCTQLIDKSFDQNYNECLRYYAKSYQYSIKPGANFGTGRLLARSGNNSYPLSQARFPRELAKQPTVTPYAGDGTINVIDNWTASTKIGATAINTSTSGFEGLNTPSGYTANQDCLFHYTADTGW
jgi:hypothetical protein